MDDRDGSTIVIAGLASDEAWYNPGGAPVQVWAGTTDRKRDAPAITDLIGGQVQVYFATLSGPAS